MQFRRFFVFAIIFVTLELVFWTKLGQKSQIFISLKGYFQTIHLFYTRIYKQTLIICTYFSLSLSYFVTVLMIRLVLDVCSLLAFLPSIACGNGLLLCLELVHTCALWLQKGQKKKVKNISLISCQTLPRVALKASFFVLKMSTSEHSQKILKKWMLVNVV